LGQYVVDLDERLVAADQAVGNRPDHQLPQPRELLGRYVRPAFANSAYRLIEDAVGPLRLD